MIAEFKAFVLRGNLVELAVAFILGVAFAAVVTAFTNIVLGTIAYIAGGSTSFDDIGVEKDGVVVIPVGAFLTALVSFLIVAFVLFLIVKAYNRTRPPTPVTTKACPFCASEINLVATRCPMCTAELPAAA
ncbi:MAG TPA: large conductance mechanosensitive channel protein MscL [Actinomycetota bacterium]|nr:large conductance mechanosensitive channel protein MscL [Actinomycetota bacterium]